MCLYTLFFYFILYFFTLVIYIIVIFFNYCKYSFYYKNLIFIHNSFLSTINEVKVLQGVLYILLVINIRYLWKPDVPIFNFPVFDFSSCIFNRVNRRYKSKY